MLDIWCQFCKEIEKNLAKEQVDELVEKLKTDIFNELDVMKGLNSGLLTKSLTDFHNRYNSDCQVSNIN